VFAALFASDWKLTTDKRTPNKRVLKPKQPKKAQASLRLACSYYLVMCLLYLMGCSVVKISSDEGYVWGINQAFSHF